MLRKIKRALLTVPLVLFFVLAAACLFIVSLLEGLYDG